MDLMTHEKYISKKVYYNVNKSKYMIVYKIASKQDNR
jgi:hypothetical protein